MDLRVYRCLRCGHYWMVNTNSLRRLEDFNKPILPGRCPECKSKKWNKVQHCNVTTEKEG